MIFSVLNCSQSKMSGFNNFSSPDKVSGLSLRVLDYEKLAGLSDAAFRGRYVEEMQTYFDEWKTDFVQCGHCFEEINGAGEMFRYFGVSLHLQCLEERYSSDKALKSIADRDYFARVLFTGKQLWLPFEV